MYSRARGVGIYRETGRTLLHLSRSGRGARLAELVKNRYASWDSGIEAGKEDFTSLEKHALSQPDPVQHTTGRQELCENIVNELI